MADPTPELQVELTALRAEVATLTQQRDEARAERDAYAAAEAERREGHLQGVLQLLEAAGLDTDTPLDEACAALRRQRAALAAVRGAARAYLQACSSLEAVLEKETCDG